MLAVSGPAATIIAEAAAILVALLVGIFKGGKILGRIETWMVTTDSRLARLEASRDGDNDGRNNRPPQPARSRGGRRGR
jgi:hypothetical protein